MGESACLVRSFSQPAETSSYGANQGDPVRALTESISFGRFMSESLSWEKWSTFSHNQYLEEVEKFFKPGSVAQKRAFFEAHYKKRAAMKAQEMLEKATATVTGVSEVESENEIPKDSSFDLESEKMDTDRIIVEETQRDESQIGLDYAMNDDSCCLPSNEMTLIKQEQTLVQQEDDMENSEQLENGDNHFESAKQEEMIIKERNSTSSSKGRRLSSSRVSRRTSELAQIEYGSASNCNISLSSSKNRSTPESLNSASRSGESSKILVTVPTESSGNRNGATSVDKKNAAELKKRLNPSSVHMSIDFASSAGQTGKISQERPTKALTTRGFTSAKIKNHVLQKDKTSIGASGSQKRLLPNSLHMSISLGSRAHGSVKACVETAKNDSNPARCSTRASVRGLSRLPPKNWQFEDQRGSKMQYSLDRGKVLNPSGSKARSSTIASPFSFQSDERAAKRKEFFKKLEQKKKEKEAIKEKLPPRSKVATTRPSSNHDRSSKPSKSSSVNAGSPRNIKEKHRQFKIHPSTSLPKKKAHENSSPNIQR